MKCSEYFCAKILWHPKKLKKDADGVWDHTSRTIAQEMIKAHLDFKDKFLLQVFNRSNQFFYHNYGCFTKETIVEFLEMWHGIRICEYESGSYHYLIPIQYTNLIDWVRSNAPTGTRELRRFPLPMYRNTEFYFTNMARQHSVDRYKRHPDYATILGPLEELTEKDKLELT